MNTQEIITAIVCVLIGILYNQAVKRSVKKQIDKVKYIEVDLWTWETDTGLPNGQVKVNEENGQMYPVLLKKGFKLQVPVITNTDSPHVRPPLIQFGDILWQYNTIVQLEGRRNLFVVFAGSPDSKKSVGCSDPKDFKETKPLNPENEMSIV